MELGRTKGDESDSEESNSLSSPLGGVQLNKEADKVGVDFWKSPAMLNQRRLLTLRGVIS